MKFLYESFHVIFFLQFPKEIWILTDVSLSENSPIYDQIVPLRKITPYR